MKLSLSKYHFAPVYIPLLYDPNPIKIMYGGRDSAKTYFACQRKVLRCIENKMFKCLMVRKFREDVKKSIFSTVKTVITNFGLLDQFKINEHESTIIHIKTGNMFMPLGLYESGGKSGTAKSVDNPTDAIVDEIDECTEEEVDKLIYSLRGTDDLELIGIFNTHKVDEDFWIVQKWFPPKETFELADGSHSYIKSKMKGVTIVHSTYMMNPFCSNTKIMLFEQQKIHQPQRFDISGLGLLKTVKLANLALKNFDRVSHITTQNIFDPNRRVLMVWDFNRIPHHTVSLWQFHHSQEDNIFYCDLFKEFCLEDMSVKEVQKEINHYLKLNGYTPKKIRLVADYSGTVKRDHDIPAMTTRIIKQAQRGGFEVIDETIPNPSVITSLDFVNDLLGGHIRLCAQSSYPNTRIAVRVHSSCKYHIADFEKTKTDKDGKILKVKATEKFIEDGQPVRRTYEIRGHAVDGLRYMGVGVFETEYLEYQNNY